MSIKPESTTESPATRQSRGHLGRNPVALLLTMISTLLMTALLSTALAASYTVKRGDTLFTIARAQGITLARLQMLNPGLAASLRPGQSLKLPDNSQPVRAAATTASSTASRNLAGLAASGNSVSRVASRHVGARYIWGASRPGAFDCSGFTMYMLRQYGVSLPHSAATQARMGRFVGRNSLEAGDLLFFATAGGSRISHVALYVGNNQMVHATNPSQGVIRSSLSERYWNNRYMGARRFL
jgi:cell wall-associated NlpC family hydrolase